MTFGILLVSADDEHLSMASDTARQIKQVMPETPIAIATDAKNPATVFDEAVPLKNPRYGWGDKVYALKHTPFEKTVYLDNDVYLTESIEELSQILDHFELAASYGFRREPYEQNNEVPTAFPELNTGVVAYRNTDATRNFFKKWEQFYEEGLKEGIDADQPSFRKAVYYDSSINFTTLTKEYNCLTNFWGFLNGRLKIIHGSHEQPRQKIAKIVNETEEPRVHVSMMDEVCVFSPSNASITDWVFLTIATHGFWDGLVQSIKLGTSYFRQFGEDSSAK